MPIFDINKICRVCLEEGLLISIYSTEYAISPFDMIVVCTNVKVYCYIDSKDSNDRLITLPFFRSLIRTNFHRQFVIIVFIAWASHINSNNNAKIVTCG